MVALVWLSVTTGTMITELAVKEAGSSAPPKFSRITAVVEKPSSALMAAWLGIGRVGRLDVDRAVGGAGEVKVRGVGQHARGGSNSAVLVVLAGGRAAA